MSDSGIIFHLWFHLGLKFLQKKKFLILDDFSKSSGASKFMGFEDILVVPVGEFSFTSPHKRVKSQISVYFCQNASECPDIVS